MRESTAFFIVIVISVVFFTFISITSAHRSFVLQKELHEAKKVIEIQEIKLMECEGIIRGLRIELDKYSTRVK